jgi:ABC-2 type transport system ATP-binding protein
LKLLGKVDDLLQEHDETQLLTSSLSENVVREVEEVLARHGAKVHKVDHPAVTLEELFLRIVKQSQERPGQRFTTGEQDGQNGRGPSPPAPEPAGTAQRHS